MEWRAVVGYEGLYEVSDSGAVRSLDRIKRNRWGDYTQRGRILKAATTKDGYPIVALMRDGELKSHRVHVLVLAAFVGPRPDGLQACHFDGDPSNNRIENLRWDTGSANTLDKIRHGTHTQAAQTHCKRGHPLTGPEADVLIRTCGRRRCRPCERDGQRRRRAEVA